MSLLTTKLELSADERNYLENELNVTQDEITAIENDDFSKIGDITRLVKILFACTKHEDAWNHIRKNMDKINYEDLFTNCQFIQMDRQATDVYKYMYDSNIIDDKSYRYFEVLSGHLNDWNFWDEQLKGMTTIEKLKFLNESYNGAISQINPYELGLVSLTKEQTDYIFGDLEEGVKVDFIFNEAPCINIEPDILRALIFNDNLQEDLIGRYFKILFNIYNTMYDITDDRYNEFYISFIDSINEYASNENRNVDITDIIIDMAIDDLTIFIKFCKLYKQYLKEYKKCYISDYNLNKVIINNGLCLMYSNTLFDEITDGKLNVVHKLSSYLNPENYTMTITYALNPRFNTEGLIIKNPFPGKYPIIYNKEDAILFVNGKVYYDYSIESDEENVFGFIDDYLIANSINDNIFKNFSCEEDYREFILVCDQFRKECMEG